MFVAYTVLMVSQVYISKLIKLYALNMYNFWNIKDSTIQCLKNKNTFSRCFLQRNKFKIYLYVHIIKIQESANI